MKLRRYLNVSLKEDKHKLQALRSACSLHAANMTLDEIMLTYVPRAEQEQFHELYMYTCLSICILVHALLHVMRFLNEHTEK